MRPWAVLISAVAVLASVALSPQQKPETGYQPTAANLAARRWFQDAKFGLFIHWGVYSVLGDGEWVMETRHMAVGQYEKLPAQFNPTGYNPDEWVALARAAGMKYITITSKHHDGFAMFGTHQSNWDIVDRTPYQKDVLKMLADACRRQGVKLFFYHSELDWHNPDYFPLGGTGHFAGRPPGGNWYRYLDYMDGQLRELLTGYGAIGGIWFDGWWDKPDADWRLARTYAMIHALQPAAMIGNNHHHLPFPGEDFQMFEKDLPGAITSEFNQGEQVSQLPLETAETVSGAWGYNKHDMRYKSVPELIQYLVRAAGANANFLLNVGPMPTGKIQPEFVERLRGVGQWLSANGDSIYGTRGGPITPGAWGVATQKGNRVFIHLLAPREPGAVAAQPTEAQQAKAQPTEAHLPKLEWAAKRAYLLRDPGQSVQVSTTKDGTTLRLAPSALDPVDTIVVVER